MKAILLSTIVLLLSLCSIAQELTLDSCLAYAQQHNRELLAKAQSVQTFQLETKSSKALLAPEISGKASLDHYWQIPVQVFPGELLNQPGKFVPVRMGTPWMGNYGLEAHLKLLDVQTWQNIKLATLRQQTSQSEWQQLQKALLKNVRMAYYNTQQQEENLRTVKSLLDNYKEVHQLITQQLEKGITDKITFNQSAQLLNVREEAYAKAGVAVQSAYLDLKFWMGYPFDKTFSIRPETNPVLTASATFNPSLLPDYEAQQLKVDLAKQEYKATFSQFYPSLRLTSSFTRMGFGNGLDFIGKSEWFNAGTIGLTLRIPLFSPGNMLYGPSRSRSQWKQASLAFENYQAQQQHQYLQATIQAEEAWTSMKTQEKNIGLAKENDELMKQKIEKGIIDMIQLREVQEKLFEAYEDLTKARITFIRQYVELNYLQNN